MKGNKAKGKKVPGRPTRTVDSVKDERFTHILKNPVYRPVPRKEKRVEIDKRFEGMFNDEKFKLKYKVDKRGRPVETTTDENLKRYYNLEEEKEEEKGEDEEHDTSEDEDSSDESDVEQDDSKIPLDKKVKEKLDEETRQKLRSSEVDYARGEADFLSDEESSSDDDSSDTEEESLVEHDWGELDKDADRTEDSTRRLALCNMDWDRVRAVDLMVLLSSFLPPGGVIKSVVIYPSQFGKERMAEEEVQGPKELRENGGIKREKDSDDEDDEDDSMDDEDEDGEGSQYHREKLRQYQLNRLKYFYAVAEFDSVQTAEKVYAECDGMEYESSAAKIDLRFIPDDMSFDEDEPKDECFQMPDAAKYRPRFFTTTALQQVKVDLTWDETDPLRKELTEKIFDPKEKVEDDDIRAYLATSSESESEDEVVKPEDEEGKDSTKESDQKSEKKSKEDPISKYKALLMSIESSEKKKKDKEVQMEITWGVGLKENTEKLVKKKLEEEDKAKRTPWQELLDKQKEKKKQRKKERKRKASDDEDEEGEEDVPFSDDDVDIDMNDEFFKSEMRENEIFKDKAKGKKVKDDKKKSKEGKKEADAALELLLMDEDDTKRHFSLKKIMDEENDTKSKKKRKNKKRKKMEDGKDLKVKDDFEIDVEDNRFAALFSSHHFNVDPSDPNYKKTKAMEKIIAEKMKRRTTSEIGRGDTETKEDNSQSNLKKTEGEGVNYEETKNKKNDISKKAELSFLVKSIKRNTENLKSKKSSVKNKFRN